eukprot:7130287-Pyramimonas_sp.AAC.1
MTNDVFSGALVCNNNKYSWARMLQGTADENGYGDVTVIFSADVLGDCASTRIASQVHGIRIEV